LTDEQADSRSGVSKLLVIGVVVVVIGLAIFGLALSALSSSPDQRDPQGAPAGVDDATPTPVPADVVESDPTPSPTVTPTASPTATDTAQPTPTQTDSADVAVNRSRLEQSIQSEINDYRESNGLRTLRITGSTMQDLNAMLRNHTAQLRADGRVWKIPDGYDIVGLYEAYDLYRQCSFKGEGEYTVHADDGKLLAVQRVDIGSGDESRIAERVMDEWGSSKWHGDKFDYENADIVGVGVTIDVEAETVYVAMSMC